MGFGIGSIVDSVKSAVSSAGNALGDVAKKVESGAEHVEQKVASVVQGAVDAVKGASGFDDPPGLGPVAESKPKGGTAYRPDGDGGTALA
ncbi:MAG TPA: hypothetical protein VND93_23280 [Myxococcales bacterium]|jgi:phage-related protein|nr:hypothetical protein [Myxococcales bacterium]